MSEKPRFNVFKADMTQRADGYSNDADGVQDLYLEFLDDYAVLQTDRWAVTPDELRKLADVIEQTLAENERYLETCCKEPSGEA